ncbi:class I SAM-dependent methyltransferase [Candidatus Microgenomates bacterium]|nr:class I SAM-dependent methyltransferase [Candidatus Microgenomates bacterium]
MSLYGERFVPTEKTSGFYKEHIQRYRFCKPYIEGKTILDLGCGTGYGSAIMLTLGAREVIGTDIDPDAIKFAKKNFKKRKLSFYIADAISLPFPNNSFDVVVSFEVIEHMKDYQQYIQEVLRVLKKKGYCIFSTPNRKQYRAGTSPYHFKEFTAQDLRELYKPFGKLELFGQFFTNEAFVEYEKEYFKHYTTLTGKNKTFKKALHLVPPEIKAWIYKRIRGTSKHIPPSEVIIKKGNLDKAITLIGVFIKK